MITKNTYEQIFQYASNCSTKLKLKASEAFNKIQLPEIPFHPNSPSFYIVDYTKCKYWYVSPSFKNIVGVHYDLLTIAGPQYFTTLWHPFDFKIINEKIFPEITTFLTLHPITDYSSFSFSFNYRVQSNERNYISVLQNSTYVVEEEDGNLLAEVGFLIDISSYIEDMRIIHTIEKRDGSFTCSSKVPLFKSIHNPGNCDSVLSKKEKEILTSIYQGMSSKQIADKHTVSINTINNQRKNMLHKTKAKNTSDLLRYAIKSGLL